MLDNNESVNYEEVMVGTDFNKWLEVMKFEIGFMYENDVWNLEDLSDNRKVIQNKWIFKKKKDINGNIIVYKVRFVVKGFR